MSQSPEWSLRQLGYYHNERANCSDGADHDLRVASVLARPCTNDASTCTGMAVSRVRIPVAMTTAVAASSSTAGRPITGRRFGRLPDGDRETLSRNDRGDRYVGGRNGGEEQWPGVHHWSGGQGMVIGPVIEKDRNGDSHDNFVMSTK